MGYIGSAPAAQVLTGSDIQDGSIQLADISVAARNDLGNTDLYGFAKTHTAETIHVAVTESGSKFYIAGVLQDTLTLYEGFTYIFTHPSGHPFRFSTNANNSPSAPYTTGTTVDSATQLTFVVPTDAPTLYYYCSNHSGMGGTALTVPMKQDVVLTHTNGADDINVTHNNTDLYDESFFSKKGLSFAVNNGFLEVTV